MQTLIDAGNAAPTGGNAQNWRFALLEEEKKGDLRGVHVYKFKITSIRYLLSYRMIKAGLELIMIGPHENYYRELKGYLKRR